MSILIKGLEMPKDGAGFLACFVLNEEGRWMFSMMNECKWYAVKTIPSPHGRLIDADVVFENIKTNITLTNGIPKSFKDTPTVVEEET